MIVFILIFFLLILILFIGIVFNMTSNQVKYPIILVACNNTTDRELCKALRYTQKEEPRLMHGANLVSFEPGSAVNALQTAYNQGHKVIITMFTSTELQQSFDFMRSHPDIQQINLYSTAYFNNKPQNILRFQVSDNTMIKYLTKIIPKNTIVYYDKDEVWAQGIASLLSPMGYRITTDSSSLSQNTPILITAVTKTQDFIRLVPNSCPKLYGMDGSIFFPFSDPDIASKAARMKFECIQYEPTVTAPIVEQIRLKSETNSRYQLANTFDAIRYFTYRQMGMSDKQIQEENTGFTGSLEMNDSNDRKYGNFALYTYTLSNIWKKTGKFLVDPDGSCLITPQKPT